MPFIGNKPTAIPLSADDLEDNIISTAKIQDNAVTAAKYIEPIPFRNIIINGDMSIAQRGTSATSIDSTNDGYLTMDRWIHVQQADDSNTGKTSMTQSTTVPSGQGFANSLKIDCTTAQTSISGTNSRVVVTQRFEGQNLQYLKKGTSSAESLTASFWVKSNKTGTYICALRDRDNSRDIAKSYTISSADTWEKKTITFEGDTTGAFDNDNARSLDVIWGLAAGSDYSSGTLQTTWGTANNANVLVGQVNLMDSTSNEWYITGVQLEAGTAASDFEFLPYDVNLQRCYRYYQMIIRNIDNSGMGMGFYSASNNARFVYFPKVTLRTIPSLDQSTASNSFRVFSAGGADDLITSWNIMDSARPNFVISNNTADASGTAGQAGYVLTNTASSYFALNAEL